MTDGLDQEDTDQEEITRKEFLAAMTGLAAATFGGIYLHDKSKEFFPFPGEITDVKGKQTWGIDNQTQVTYIEREKFSILPFTYPTQAQLQISNEEEATVVEDYNNNGRVDGLWLSEEIDGRIEGGHYIKRGFPFGNLEYDRGVSEERAFSQKEAESTIARYDQILQLVRKAYETDGDLQGIKQYLS